jgi:hypothetical protein
MKWFKIRFLSISSTVSSTGQMHTDSRKGLGWGRYENLVTISKKHKRGTFHIFYTYSLSSQICRQNSCWSWRILCKEIRFLKVLNKFKISPSIGQLCYVSFHFFTNLGLSPGSHHWRGQNAAGPRLRRLPLQQLFVRRSKRVELLLGRLTRFNRLSRSTNF